MKIDMEVKIIGVFSFILFVLYSLLGIILFFNPVWSATQFAWKISPFVAMTIGGWCIGCAFFAWKSFQSGEWKLIYPNLIFLWIFGILETLILVAFKNKVLINSTMAIIYTGTLILNSLFAIFGIWFLAKNNLPKDSGNITKPKWLQNGFNIGIFLVSGIALGALTTANGGIVTSGKFLPETLSLFTVRAFGAFYLSLVLTGLTLIKNKSILPVLAFIEGGLILTIPITIAALKYFPLDRLVYFPGGMIYIFAYIVVVFAVVPLLAYYYPKIKSVK